MASIHAGKAAVANTHDCGIDEFPDGDQLVLLASNDREFVLFGIDARILRATQLVTRRQQQVLSVLLLSMQVHRTTPPIRRLAEMCGFSSVATAYNHLRNLEKQGYLERPSIRPHLFVTTEKADVWWQERKRADTALPVEAGIVPVPSEVKV
jgi:hypothetical protein